MFHIFSHVFFLFFGVSRICFTNALVFITFVKKTIICSVGCQWKEHDDLPYTSIPALVLLLLGKTNENVVRQTDSLLFLLFLFFFFIVSVVVLLLSILYNNYMLLMFVRSRIHPPVFPLVLLTSNHRRSSVVINSVHFFRLETMLFFFSFCPFSFYYACRIGRCKRKDMFNTFYINI